MQFEMQGHYFIGLLLFTTFEMRVGILKKSEMGMGFFIKQHWEMGSDPPPSFRTLQITFDWRHFPSSGQSRFFLQLQVSGCCAGELKFERTYLCDEMTDFMLGMQEQLSFSVCLLKALVDNVQKFSPKVSSDV